MSHISDWAGALYQADLRQGEDKYRVLAAMITSAPIADPDVQRVVDDPMLGPLAWSYAVTALDKMPPEVRRTKLSDQRCQYWLNRMAATAWTWEAPGAGAPVWDAWRRIHREMFDVTRGTEIPA